MNLSDFAAAAAQNEWSALLPEIALGCLALLLLALEMLMPRGPHGRIAAVAQTGLTRDVTRARVDQAIRDGAFLAVDGRSASAGLCHAEPALQ